MDNLDKKILRCLKENARMKASAIAERINLSVPTVIERIRKMESAGIIRQYTVVLDHDKVGKGLMAFISVGIDNPQYNADMIHLARMNPSIMECHYVTGDRDFLLKVRVANSDELEQVLHYIKQIKGVSATRTLVVLSTTKEEIAVIPGS